MRFVCRFVTATNKCRSQHQPSDRIIRFRFNPRVPKFGGLVPPLQQSISTQNLLLGRPIVRRQELCGDVVGFDRIVKSAGRPHVSGRGIRNPSETLRINRLKIGNAL